MSNVSHLSKHQSTPRQFLNFDYIADRLSESFSILFITTRVAPPSGFLVNFSKEFTLNPYQGRRIFVYTTFPPSFQDIPKDSTFSTLRLSKTESVVRKTVRYILSAVFLTVSSAELQTIFFLGTPFSRKVPRLSPLRLKLSISSGNKEIVEGCKIAKQFKVIYGCEYIFDPVTGVPVWPKLAINYTQKTQYFFRISKGAVDATDDKGVNEKAKEKRIPYSNIIYIGDGMTDIPSMIIVKDNGGKSIAVYPKGKEDRVKDLYDDGRVNYVCPANYKEGSEIEKVMKLIIQGVAINESLKTRENQNVMQD